MSVTRLSPLCLVLILASSALGTFPFAYPDFQAPAAPLSFTPHLIYRSSGIDGGHGDLAGYSYFTKDFDGGASEVVFLTGPNSDIKMNEEVAAMKDQMTSSLPSATTAETKFDKDENKEVKSESTDNQDPFKIAPLVPVETKESSSTPVNDVDASTTATPMQGDKKDADSFFKIFNGQLFPEKGAGFETPYPILRLGGSASFYPQLQTSFSGFAGYGPSDYFRSQYVPFLNNYNPYQSLYNPLYSSLDTDYYNPGVFPSAYQNPIFTPTSTSGASFILEKPQDDLPKAPTSAPLVDRRIAQPESSDQKTEEDSSTTEKGTELPTTTEQLADKPTTTVADTASTTVADEINETTTTTASPPTTVVSDAVAVA